MAAMDQPSAHGDLGVARSAPDKELTRWQRKLLPFMVRFMVALAIVFFAMSLFDVMQVKNAIFNEHGEGIRAIMQERVAFKTGETHSPEDAMRGALLLLESDALDKRYHQASALLMSRIWTKHLSFLTGMVLTFLGATFVLGKLSEGASNIAGSGAGWKAEVTSSSPGIILAFFGTVLLTVSLLVQTKIDVQDSPVYVYGEGLAGLHPGLSGIVPTRSRVTGNSPEASATLPKPPDILDLGKEERRPSESQSKR